MLYGVLSPRSELELAAQNKGDFHGPSIKNSKIE